MPRIDKFGLQFAEILDNPVMHQRDPRGSMRMRIALGGGAVGRPACVSDAGQARPAVFPPSSSTSRSKFARESGGRSMRPPFNVATPAES